MCSAHPHIRLTPINGGVSAFTVGCLPERPAAERPVGPRARSSPGQEPPARARQVRPPVPREARPAELPQREPLPVERLRAARREPYLPRAGRLCLAESQAIPPDSLREAYPAA